MTPAGPPGGRVAVIGLAVLTALALVALFTAALGGSHAAIILFDYHGVTPPGYPFVFPFTIQNLMHLLLAVGLGEL